MNRLSVLLWRVRSWAAGALVARRRVESRGVRFTLQSDNWITYYRWKTYNTKEPETLDWIDKWVKPGDTLFDIGANIGVYSVYAALKHKPIRVVAFEPEYANLHLLRDNVMHNHIQDVVDIYSIALGNDSGPTHLHIQDFTPGAALHSVSNQQLDKTHTLRPVVGREGIWVVTMDAFCDKTGMTPHCVKIDVDGTELAILEGARKTFASKSMRSAIIEMPPKSAAYDRCAAMLEEAGLKLKWRSEQSPNELWVRE